MEIVHYYKEAFQFKEFTLHFLLFEVEDEFFEAHIYEDAEVTYIHSCYVDSDQKITIPVYFENKSDQVFNMLYKSIEEDYQGEF